MLQTHDGELSLLQKGLTFVDTPPPPDLGVLCEDLNKFHLSIKRKLALSGLNLPNTTEIPRQGNTQPFQSRKFTNRSNWNPPAPGIVEHMSLLNESALQNSILSPKLLNLKRNLTKAEVNAKSSLQRNHDIVIKKADKGSNVVIQNKTDYINEGLKQLSDRKFYRLQEESLTAHHNSLIKQAIDDMVQSKEISSKTADYLFIENPRTAKFYLLPKIHKNKLPPPGRPIVSANECPSERISQFVDNFIQPMVMTLPSYLRDSSHLLNIIRHLKVPPGAILATLDVTSLYTNIPNDEGILAASRYLFRHRDPSINPTDHSICKLLELVLKTNNFEFDNKEFLQVGGTAMGTKLAPSFANLFMGYFEEKYVAPYSKQPFLWKRFIDDIFIIWTYGPDELTRSVTYLNSVHETIKFTCEHSIKSVDFLDVTIQISETNQLNTTLFCKPTDTHNYLLYSSEHPRHLLNGIPYSQLLRVRRICSDSSEFKRNAMMLCTHFIRRGYPKHLVKAAYERSNALDRDELLNKELLKSTSIDPVRPLKQATNTTDTFYCITNHNPKNPPIREIINTNWDVLQKTKTTRNIFESNIIFGLRRNKNLSDHLVRASTKTKTQHQTHISTHPCNRSSQCRYCSKINHRGHTNSKLTSKKFTTMTNINCQSSNIIYLITCTTCGIQYVGQTKNRLLTRFQGHHFDIKNQNDTTVARHFNRCPSSRPAGFDGLELSVLSFIKNPSNSKAGQLERDREEKRWIHRLATVVPKGLNTMD